MYSLFLCFCSLTISFILSNILQYEFKSYDMEIPYIKITFPIENYTFETAINTFNSYSHFKKYFNPYNFKKKKQQVTLQLDEQYPLSFVYTTDIDQAHNLIFYYARDSIWTRESGLSFGDHFDNDSFSFVHSLYNSGAISHKEFTIFNMKASLNGKLCIGGIPNEENTMLPYKGITLDFV